MHHEAQTFSTTALPRSDESVEVAVLVEPLEREVRAPAGRSPRAAALLRSPPSSRDERPREQDEEERDEADGHALGDEPRARRHRYFEMMKTGVPISTWRKSHSASGIRIRMQPCEAEYPIDAASGVPWIPTYGAEIPIQRVPSGLPGPGGTGSESAAQSDGGGYHHGFRCKFTIS